MAAAVLGTVSASAQFFVGGSLDYSSRDKLSSFTFAPKVGYTVSDKLEVGINFSYESQDVTSTTSNGTGGSTTTTVTESVTGFGAFGRYKFLEADKWSLWGRANLSVRSPEGMSTVSLNVAPVVKYALSDKVNLLSAVNLLNLGFSSTSYDGGGSSYTTFNIGAGGSAPISIGVEFKF